MCYNMDGPGEGNTVLSEISQSSQKDKYYMVPVWYF